MSDSDSENENFCFLGSPLEPYDEDAFPKKKPISVEEQIATDSHGRRRFHGAFTGGFSAGFFNTVGSLEGWTPKEFRSTRQEKAESHLQKPEDFMDEEDLGEYGIAHQTVRATKDYNSSKKRKKQVFTEGPIPGEPVLHTLFTSGNETVGYLLLKNIGLQEKLDKYAERNSQQTSGERHYGCQIPQAYRISEDIFSNKQYEIPTIYKEFLAKPKYNTFGLGYEGLDRSHLNLFQTTDLVVSDKNNKKISIRGQAFGVGAFEEDDDDIYAKEDMTRYDFELTGEKINKKVSQKSSKLLHDKFVSVKTTLSKKKVFSPPVIPHSFTGKHKVRKSRFEPLVEAEESQVTRSAINPAIRAKYLGETSTNDKSCTDPTSTATIETKPTVMKESGNSAKFDLASALLSDRFVSSGQSDNVSNILEPVEKMETEHGTEQMRAAAKMKMFGPLTRITIDWQPCSLLCKRFNVPEPFADRPESSRKRTKNLIFEYQQHAEDQNDLRPGLHIQKSEDMEGLGNTNLQLSSIDTTQSLHLQIEDNAETIKEEEDQIKIKEEVEVDLPKDLTEKVNIEEKTDLFKAVFLSSSEESEDEETQDKKGSSNIEQEKQKSEEIKASVLSEPLIPKIRPLKQGILSNISFQHSFSKPTKSSEKVNEDVEEIKDVLQETVKKEQEGNDNWYGPKIPEKLLSNAGPSVSKQITVSSESEDEWVEKTDKKEKKKKHKKEKKHKKNKHKKQKHEKK